MKHPVAGMTSDSDFPGDSSVALNSVTAPSGTFPGTITSETSAADLSHDDTEKEVDLRCVALRGAFNELSVFLEPDR